MIVTILEKRQTVIATPMAGGNWIHRQRHPAVLRRLQPISPLGRGKAL